MAHENLNLVIDFAKIKEILKDGSVHFNVKTDKKGEHKYLTFFVKARKKKDGITTHNVTVKTDGAWRDLRDEHGKIIYVGSAALSKYQPDEDGDNVKRQSTTSPEDII